MQRYIINTTEYIKYVNTDIVRKMELKKYIKIINKIFTLQYGLPQGRIITPKTQVCALPNLSTHSFEYKVNFRHTCPSLPSIRLSGVVKSDRALTHLTSK